MLRSIPNQHNTTQHKQDKKHQTQKPKQTQPNQKQPTTPPNTTQTNDSQTWSIWASLPNSFGDRCLEPHSHLLRCSGLGCLGSPNSNRSSGESYRIFDGWKIKITRHGKGKSLTIFERINTEQTTNKQTNTSKPAHKLFTCSRKELQSHHITPIMIFS